MVRLFFKVVRWILGPFLLLWEWLTRPAGIVRSPADQQAVDRECEALSLYQFATCPFCIKVRQEMRRLSLNIRRLDALKNESRRNDLARGGGRIMVPCLRIKETTSDGESDIWLYESGKIIEYLRKRFAKGTPV